MGKMKDLIIEVLEMFNDDHMSYTEIASYMGMSVDEVALIIEQYKY